MEAITPLPESNKELEQLIGLMKAQGSSDWVDDRNITRWITEAFATHDLALRDKVLGALQKYYSLPDEQGNYQFDPADNQLIDQLRTDVMQIWEEE